jgi:hypothetical protein
MIGGGLTLLLMEMIAAMKSLGPVAATVALSLPIFIAGLAVLSAAMLWMTFRIRRMLQATLVQLVPAAEATAPPAA